VNISPLLNEDNMFTKEFFFAYPRLLFAIFFLIMWVVLLLSDLRDKEDVA
jgi:hypothetical protein